MAGKRKQRRKSPAADAGNRTQAGTGATQSSAQSPISAARAPGDRQPWWAGKIQPDPPRQHVWFLIASAVAVGLWMLFLTVMAWSG